MFTYELIESSSSIVSLHKRINQENINKFLIEKKLSCFSITHRNTIVHK